MAIDLGIDHLVDAELVGRGGFGVVYAATDTRFDRRVAVKVLGWLLSEKDRLAFERECKIMGRMSTHPNVVTVYEAGYNRTDNPYLVMELVTGGSLADRLNGNGSIPWEKAVEYTIPVADGLGFGHSQGIEHRDVKPENILLDGETPRLTDFGIARLRDATGSTSTQITASWLHAPPETFANKRDSRSDLYSLVSTLHTLITGTAPFWSPDDESLSPLMFRLLNEPPPILPAELGPPQLAELLQEGLAKDPASRPQTAAELVQRLRGVLQAASPPEASSATTGSRAFLTNLEPLTQPAPSTPVSEQPATPLPPSQPVPSPSVSEQPAAPLPPSQPVPSPPVSEHPAAPEPPPSQPAPSTPVSEQPTAPRPPIVPEKPDFEITPPGQRPPPPRQRKTLLVSSSILAILVLAGIVVAVQYKNKTTTGSSSTTSSTRAGATTSAPGKTPAAATASVEAISDPTKLPTNMDDWEKLWAQQRATIVKRIKDNKWGVSADGKTLTGPQGFTVDLSACPSGWSETEGLSDTEIKLGQTLAQSGTLAFAANYGRGQEAIQNFYANKGAFTDSNGKNRKITYIQKDDAYDPARTVPLVDTFLDSEKVFGLTTLGSPNTLKTYDKLNQRCVPHLFNQSGHPAWGDPANHPWTSGLSLSYNAEASLWGKFIENHISEFPNGVTVAALLVDNDFGKIYNAGITSWLSSSPVSGKVRYVTETVDATATTITTQMATLDSKKPDIFIAAVAGTFCSQAVIEAEKNGMHTDVKYLFQPNTCAGSTQLSKEKVGGTGAASEGWWIVNGGWRDIRDPNQQSDPVVAWARDIIKAHGDNPDSAAELGLGLAHGWAWSQVLMIAGQLDGGLTRANTILAARSMNMNSPMSLPGIVLHTDGNKDAYFVEGGPFQQFDTAKQSYISKTDPFNADGKTKNCKFSSTSGTCTLY